MLSVLCDSEGNPRDVVMPEDARFEVGLESIRDVLQLDFVLTELFEMLRDNAEAQKRLRRLLKDPVIPSAERADSFGRDIQSELYVAAVCQRAELGPRFAEPDVYCSRSEPELGIAVKRLTSRKGFEEAIRGAAGQIDKSEFPGIIVVETSIALNPENRRISWPWAPDESDRLHAQHIRKFLDENGRMQEMQECVRGKDVRGIIVHDHQVMLTPDRSWGLKSINMPVSTARGNQRREREFSEFTRRYKRGLPSR